ncbi:MAG: STAS domain-containing protein [Kibdelosporangium sp.]
MRDTNPLKWHVEQEAGAAVVRLAGEIDLATEEDFAEALEHGLRDQPPVIMIDLTEVTFLGSAGLHVLLQANDAARRQGCALRVAHGGAFAQRVLSVAGLDQVLAVFELVDEKSLRAAQPPHGGDDLGVRDTL